MTNYKSPDFDTVAVLANNTHNLPGGARGAQGPPGGRGVLLSGSVFEGGEGAGSQGLPDFSPYGLSKALTVQVFRFDPACAGVGLGKFVIPNPFGPYEEPRFTAYLMKNWLAGATPNCSSPAYVRDNIHVSLLATAYARFAGHGAGPGIRPGQPQRIRREPAAPPSAWPRTCSAGWDPLPRRAEEAGPLPRAAVPRSTRIRPTLTPRAGTSRPPGRMARYYRNDCAARRPIALDEDLVARGGRVIEGCKTRFVFWALPSFPRFSV